MGRRESSLTARDLAAFMGSAVAEKTLLPEATGARVGPARTTIEVIDNRAYPAGIPREIVEEKLGDEQKSEADGDQHLFNPENGSDW
jgi:hypothetical protein